MRTGIALMLYLLLAGGCREQVEIPDSYCERGDMKVTNPADMLPATPKCAAAKGITGDNLICVDFNKITALSDPKLAEWNFSSSQSGECVGWEIMAGVLDIKNLGSITSATCGLSPPKIDLSQEKFHQYNSVTLSIIHRLDLNDPNQIAQIFIGNDLTKNQVWRSTGTNLRQISTITVDKADLPSLNGNYPFIFKLTASAMGLSSQNWFIESIAINGNL